MELKEYYEFPEGTNVKMNFIPHWLLDKPNFPCLSNMSYTFINYGGEFIVSLDVSNVTNMDYMFQNCNNLILIDGIKDWDVSKVTTMNSMFYNCKNLTSIDSSNWDTSGVTTMSNMFYGCEKLTSIDLSNWDTSGVTTMNSMFYNCKNLTSIDGIKDWDTSKVTNMGNMFYNCENLTSIDLSGCNTSGVTTMDGMFNGCKNLTSVSSIRADKISISTYSSPFGTSNNTVLTDFGGFINLKNSWNGNHCVNKLTVLSHQSLINILNGLYDFTGNNQTPTSSQGKIKFGSTHLATLSDDEKAIATNKGWTLS